VNRLRDTASARVLRNPVATTENEQVVTDSEANALVLQTLLLEAIDSANMAICVYDERGRYVTVNECACKILGYSRDELLWHDVADFTEGGIDRTVLSRNEHREGVRMVTRKDGTKVPCAFVVTPTRVGHLPYFIAVWWTLDHDDPRADGAA
jgi:PAS domain S-box-containing protein